jgi:hypothetical protein
MIELLVNNELQGTWKEVIVSYLRHYPNICLEWLMKNTKHFSQDSRYPAQIWARFVSSMK